MAESRGLHQAWPALTHLPRKTMAKQLGAADKAGGSACWQTPCSLALEARLLIMGSRERLQSAKRYHIAKPDGSCPEGLLQSREEGIPPKPNHLSVQLSVSVRLHAGLHSEAQSLWSSVFWCCISLFSFWSVEALAVQSTYHLLSFTETSAPS